MNKLIAVFVLLIFGACRPNEVAIKALHRDVVKLTLANADLKVRLDQSEQQRSATAQELAKVSERVRQLEIRTLTLPPAAVPANTFPVPLVNQEVIDPPHRGGFTDFARRAPENPTRMLQSTQNEAQSATVRIAPDSSAATRNDVAKASDFYDAEHKMIAKCEHDWPSDKGMSRSCMDRQTEALTILRQGRPFGANEVEWNRARIRCANAWPDDYQMRVHCEQTQ